LAPPSARTGQLPVPVDGEHPQPQTPAEPKTDAAPSVNALASVPAADETDKSEHVVIGSAIGGRKASISSQLGGVKTRKNHRDFALEFLFLGRKNPRISTFFALKNQVFTGWSENGTF
jgi:hypothetical protein